MQEERCPNCFQAALSGGVCRRCGFDRREEKKNANRLAESATLANRYVIGRILGCGGFGITYKAYDAFNHCCCAIKEFVPTGIVRRDGNTTTLHVTSASNREDFDHGKKRFMDEAEVLKRLMDIPEVVQITDYFMQNNTAYFVMEYVEGVNLRQLMQTFGGRIPVRDARSLLYRAGMALDRVHRRANIFHRDISPDNIMVDANGNVRLIDFGNAKSIIGTHSQTLSVILKHGYAPPEQYSSTSSQGSYTDVYALAATFYYVTTGVRIPNAPDRFGGETYRPLREMQAEITPEISDAVDRALILNSRERTQSAAELVRPFLGEREEAVSGRPYLKLAGGGAAYAWNIPENKSVMIGRSSDFSDIVPARDSKISKRHCELYCDSLEKSFYLIDHSTNGTYADGMRLEKGKPYILRGGQFSLGNHICDLEVGWKNG